MRELEDKEENMNVKKEIEELKERIRRIEHNIEYNNIKIRDIGNYLGIFFIDVGINSDLMHLEYVRDVFSEKRKDLGSKVKENDISLNGQYYMIKEMTEKLETLVESLNLEYKPEENKIIPAKYVKKSKKGG